MHEQDIRAKSARKFRPTTDSNHSLPVADNYGKLVGCKRVRIEGRPGWERVLTGYTKRRVVLVKELGDE